jgi:hypothetical protein
MRFKTLLFLALSTGMAWSAGPVWAQGRGDDDKPPPFVPAAPGVVPLPADAKPQINLEFDPSVTLDNGVMKAKVFLPDKPDSFYHGTRFDNFGTIGSLVYGDTDFYKPWFDFTADVRDYVMTNQGVVAGFASADAGPVEEFSTDNKGLGFDEAPVGGSFIKIGVGVLRKSDDQPYSQFRTYAVVDPGKKTVKSTKNQITFTQDIFDPDNGYGYHYVKTLRLVPGKPQLVIEHTLKNTGKKAFSTTVYDHNFLTVGNQDVEITVPYTLTPPARPAPADLIKMEGHTISFLRPMALYERGFVLPMAGFGNSAADYAFEVKNTVTGKGVSVKGDQPLVANALFAVHTIAAVEPRISMDLPVGGEKKWTYTYTYTAPKMP